MSYRIAGKLRPAALVCVAARKRDAHAGTLQTCRVFKRSQPIESFGRSLRRIEIPEISL